MSGINQSPQEYDAEVTLLPGTFENFTIHPATIYINELDAMEPGYAVVYGQDMVCQAWCPSIAVAISVGLQCEQQLALAKQLQQEGDEATSTEGLLGDALDIDGDDEAV